MKKLYILLFIGLGLPAYTQTYTMEFQFKKPGIACNEVSWYLNDYVWDDYITIGTKIYTDVPNYKIFELSTNFMCPVQTPRPACENVSIYKDEKTAIQLIKGSSLSIIGCYVNIQSISFKPNVTIENSKTTSEICGGEEVILQASPSIAPNKFPDEAYHWQYSLNGISNWIDLPENKNNTPITGFKIEDLKNSAIKYLSTIYFRLGYNQNRPFTNSLALKYYACGPTISDVNFKGPTCNGDIVKSLSVTFNEKLNFAIGEQLASISVVDTQDDSKIFIQTTGSILYSDDTKKYTYSSFQQLENGHIYRIKYQAQIPNPIDPSNPIGRGVLYSPEEFNFQYREPEPLKFEIVKADNPLCPNDLAEVAIAVSGGTGDYKFYLDGIEKINPKPVKEVDECYHIRGLVPTDINSIKVVDENNCIEKTL
ncbi:hypothetical protein [Flavobacterium sp.]|uniref:hypothetical protein n=1 Tax=Flavobacterium sp. TaxID=239 RepID=UPI0032669B89